MDDKLLNCHTLSRGNPFLWFYDGKEIFISKRDKHMKENTFTFKNEEVDGLMRYILKKGKLPLANSVSMVPDGTEKDGIGKYIYNNIHKNTSLVQAASELVAILYNADVLYYNNKKKGMEFWINNYDWKQQLLNLVEE